VSVNLTDQAVEAEQAVDAPTLAIGADQADVAVDAPKFDLGAWLVERRGLIDGNEAAWLDVLAEFDRNQLWALDGQISAPHWLMWRVKMRRSTAFEKLRIAHELRRRPQVAAAFASGDISYSAVRAVTRIDDPGPEVDAALVSVARESSVFALEKALRYYTLHDEQHRPLSPLESGFDARGLHLSRMFNGKGAAEAVLDDVELEELRVCVEAFLDKSAVDESSRGDSLGLTWAQRRADAFMEMVRTAWAHAQDGQAVGADRYLIHAVAEVKTLEHGAGGLSELADGTPLAASTLARLACDCSSVMHSLQDGEPLNLGRKTKEWSTAQRRAISVRDGGRCRFPGCDRSRVDIHHMSWWSKGGNTDVANGFLCCARHHGLLHKGFFATGDANRELTFHRPDGSALETNSPPGTSPVLRVL